VSNSLKGPHRHTTTQNNEHEYSLLQQDSNSWILLICVYMSWGQDKA